MAGTIKMRAELHALLRHFAQLIETEDLKTTGVGENWPLPRHEAMQPSHLTNSVVPRPQIKMVSVTEKDLNPKLFQNVLRNPLDRAESAYRHKDRSFDLAVRSSQLAQASRTIISRNGKGERHEESGDRAIE